MTLSGKVASAPEKSPENEPLPTQNNRSSSPPTSQADHHLALIRGPTVFICVPDSSPARSKKASEREPSGPNCGFAHVVHNGSELRNTGFSMPEYPPVSREELRRIERFVAAFNTLDNWLQSQPDAPPTFRSSLDWWARRHPYWRDAETLRLFTSLRNFLVHETVRPFDYPCVPSESAVREIEAIRERLLHPVTIGQKFGREVVSLRTSDTLDTALHIMNARDIARFVSFVVARGETFSAQTPIAQVLPRQSKRQTFRFAPPETSVTQAAFWFGENTFLEAVLIAARSGERPTGIVTRGDVAGWRE